MNDEYKGKKNGEERSQGKQHGRGGKNETKKIQEGRIGMIRKCEERRMG